VAIYFNAGTGEIDEAAEISSYPKRLFSRPKYINVGGETVYVHKVKGKVNSNNYTSLQHGDGFLTGGLFIDMDIEDFNKFYKLTKCEDQRNGAIYTTYIKKTLIPEERFVFEFEDGGV